MSQKELNLKKNISWNQSHLRLDETDKDISFKFLFPKEACLVA